MAHKLRVPDSIAVTIRALHPNLKQKIRAALELILAEPHSGKALRGEQAGLMTYRVSRFRIVYRIGRDRVVELVAVGPRESIYEETYRLVSKETVLKD
ncbi:MAG: type II toxin-antitoxin system RelE/ParE family toxin [Nitrospirota bacterium]|nr:type II toxin-antitoxin system RelE/ParE family toxin [Nitrospirota bacterium]